MRHRPGFFWPGRCASGARSPVVCTSLGCRHDGARRTPFTPRSSLDTVGPARSRRTLGHVEPERRRASASHGWRPHSRRGASGSRFPTAPSPARRTPRRYSTGPPLPPSAGGSGGPRGAVRRVGRPMVLTRRSAEAPLAHRTGVVPGRPSSTPRKRSSKRRCERLRGGWDCRRRLVPPPGWLRPASRSSGLAIMPVVTKLGLGRLVASPRGGRVFDVPSATCCEGVLPRGALEPAPSAAIPEVADARTPVVLDVAGETIWVRHRSPAPRPARVWSSTWRHEAPEVRIRAKPGDRRAQRHGTERRHGNVEVRRGRYGVRARATRAGGQASGRD